MDSALATVSQKIKQCGVELLAWGSSTIHLDHREIKNVQKKLLELNKSIPTEQSRQ